jgi:hypothetical protein
MLRTKEIKETKAYKELTHTQQELTMTRNNIASLKNSYKLIEKKGLHHWSKKTFSNYQNKLILTELWEQRENINMKKIEGSLNAIRVARENFEKKITNLCIDMEKMVDFEFTIEYSEEDGYVIVKKDDDTIGCIEIAIEHIRSNGIYTKSNHSNN